MKNRLSPLRVSQGQSGRTPSHLQVALLEPEVTEGGRFAHLIFQCWHKEALWNEYLFYFSVQCSSQLNGLAPSARGSHFCRTELILGLPGSSFIKTALVFFFVVSELKDAFAFLRIHALVATMKSVQFFISSVNVLFWGPGSSKPALVCPVLWMSPPLWVTVTHTQPFLTSITS